MKTYQVIMKSGLTRVIEADRFEKGQHALEFQMDEKVTYMFRTETVLRVESFDDSSHHEVIFSAQDLAFAAESAA